MWTCSHCGEKIEDQFDGCWNCGWTKVGEAPPADFHREEDTRSLEERMSERFVCIKCKCKNVATSRFHDIQSRQFITLSCTTCGHTEIYDSKVLEDNKHYLGNILDVIFGKM